MEKYSSLSLKTRSITPAVLGALASVLFVALVTYAATTINNNVNTGGTLTVSGDSTLTGTTTASAIYASSTAFVDGIFTNTRNAILGAASGTPTVTGLNVTGSGYLTGGLGVGYATTGSGDLVVSGLGIFQSTGRLSYGSTSPYREVGLAGNLAVGGALGTTTISAETTTAGRSGCIQLQDVTNGRWIRIYPGATQSTTTNTATLMSGGKGLLVVEVGQCK